MLTDIGKKRLKKSKHKQYISYDEIKVATSFDGVVSLSLHSKGVCISNIESKLKLQIGNTLSISNIIGELEVTRKVVLEKKEEHPSVL